MQSHPESHSSQFLDRGHQNESDGLGLRSLDPSGTAEAVPVHRYDPIPQEASAGLNLDTRVSGNIGSMSDIETAACDAVLREQVFWFVVGGFLVI